MPTSHHHAEWLSLIEVSGPFLTTPVLDKVFPQGLDAHDPELARLLKLAHEQWEDGDRGGNPSAAIHRAWMNFVLGEGLGLPAEVLAEGQAIPQSLKATVAEHAETLRPDVVVRNPGDGSVGNRPRMLIQTYDPTQDLERPISGRHWKASPAARMMELLHATDVRLGLVTNGERWMLVDAPKGETTGFASWYATLWFEEPLTLRAFRSLLGVRRFFSVPDGETLEAMLAESALRQQEVTDRLGYQVREAVEEIVRSLDQIDQDQGRELLAGIPESELYEAALTVMMRLVFLFSAEERGLLLLGDSLFDEHYAVSTLVAKLQEAADQHGEEVLERRHDAWVRLLATFRAVYGGIEHERLRLLPYSGKLFDPDRFAFLEGRPKRFDANGNPVNDWTKEEARPLPIDNRTVLHLLRSLQYLEMHSEARRLSFRALDIEQIGHVYEGLLDHTAKRATEPMISLVAAKGDEPEVAVSELERLAGKAGGDGSHAVSAEDLANNAALMQYLKEQTGRSDSALKKALKDQSSTSGPPTSAALLAGCGNDRSLFERLRPFAGLIRNDTFGRPVVIIEGSVFVTAGTDRRASGTHYTPRSLTEPIVQYTLEPLVYVGPPEGKPKEEWTLRRAKELLELKICDMACGSGAFLVQACRYLSERLVEAWEDAEKQHPGVPGITPEGTASIGAPNEQLIPKDTNERLAYARRIVAQRCLYGVDKNPLAVEMAKLSLWLLTLAKDKPFTFLDHAIRRGDSLIGIHDLEQLRTFNLDLAGDENQLFLQFLERQIREVVRLRTQIESTQSNRAEDVEFQERLLKQAADTIERVKYSADMLVGAEFLRWDQSELIHDELAIEASDADEDSRPAPEWMRAKRPTEKFRRAARTTATIRVASLFNHANIRAFKEESQTWLNGQVPFHWPLEFAEVMVDRSGFDALVCNPPFMGGQKITGNLGEDYREYLVEQLAHGQRGSADICAYFLLHAGTLLRPTGQLGFLATNTIAQGDTREVGLDQLAAQGCAIPRAVPSRPWPGEASLEVAHIWIRKGPWSTPYILDDKPVSGITSFLTEPGAVTGKPYRLKANEGKSFIGSYVLGMGFVLTPEEAQRLIDNSSQNRKVLFPYLNGEDLNSRPDQSPSRWVINFFDWPLDRETAPEAYDGPVAADYPDCLAIVQSKVKPERMKNNRKERREKWWQYPEKCPALYRAIAGMERVLAVCRVTKHLAPVILPANWVFSIETAVFCLEPCEGFAVLQSSIYDLWVRAYSSTLETRLRFSPSDCFDTFPLPKAFVVDAGRAYEEYRREVTCRRQEGLTKIYNRFHAAEELAADIQKLRELHVEIDRIVAAAYGWDDLVLGHGFHETKQGARFTISDSARREVLARLLKLNQQRHSEEVAQGLHDKKGGRTRATEVKSKTAPRAKRPKHADDTPSLPFADGPDEPPPAGNFGKSSVPPHAGNAGSFVREDYGVQAPKAVETRFRLVPIDQIETDEVMAAFRQAARNRGAFERDELLKEASRILGYQRLGSKIEEALRGHLRAAIRRRIIEADGPAVVRAGTGTMADYELEELRETFRSVMRKGTNYDREDIVHGLARYLGFVRVTDTIRQPIKSAMNSAIRQGLLGYQGDEIWRED
jgi:methylase of polypeptide subunit release factors